MSTQPIPFTPELLLEHEQFLRSVAAGLLRDDDAASDVVQDTWLKVLTRAPRQVLSVGGWLRTVTTNRAKELRRSSARRELREQRAARPEELESVDATYERLAMQREVVNAILALAEPYKSVVILRYYHDLEPSQIATRLAAKPATVRTQLVRAHEQLRQALDRRFDGRDAWAGVLLPLVGKGARRLSLLAPVASVAALVGAGALTWIAIRSTDLGGLVVSGSDSKVPATRSAAVGSTNATNDESGPGATAGSSASAMSARDVTLDAGTALSDPREASDPPSNTRGEIDAQSPPPSVPEPTFAELIEARAVVLDRAKHNDNPNAAFSFEHAIGGQAGLKKTRNDWDVVLDGGKLRACTVVNDHSLIVDLGSRTFEQLCRVSLTEIESSVATASMRRFAPSDDPNSEPFRAEPAVLGHLYFLWTLDDDSDLATLFHVAELGDDGRCVLDWYSTTDGRIARGSLRSPTGARALIGVALGLRDCARAVLNLREPRVVIQARTGAIGGNPCTIDIARNANARFARVSSEPLDLVSPVTINDRSVAYCDGGTIPKDMKFVVTHVAWSGEAHGDTNGHGRLKVVLARQELVDIEQSDDPVHGEWSGRVELLAGDEDSSYLEILNSSFAEMTFEGVFEPRH